MRRRRHHRLVVTVTVTVANTESRWYVAACIGGRVEMVISRVFFKKKKERTLVFKLVVVDKLSVCWQTRGDGYVSGSGCVEMVGRSKILLKRRW